MTGPSERDPAVEAAINRLVARVAARTAEDVLATMTDPERGEGSYVRLGDVLDLLRAKADEEMAMASVWRERGNSHRQDAAECERRAQVLRNLVDDLREHRERRLR
jgi:hypothetical protein